MPENTWDRYYEGSKDKCVDCHVELIEAIKRTGDIKGLRVLEVGAGRGFDSMRLAELGARSITIDSSGVSADMIYRSARSRNTDVDVIQADALNLPLKDSCVDLVFHQGFLEHFSRPEGILREQKRVLRDKGYILVDVPQRYNLWTIKKAFLMRFGAWFAGWETSYTVKGLRRAISNIGFEVTEVYQRDYYPDIFRKMKNLKKAELKIFRRQVLPAAAWKFYERCWENFERSFLSRIMFKSIGVMARKV